VLDVLAVDGVRDGKRRRARQNVGEHTRSGAENVEHDEDRCFEPIRQRTNELADRLDSAGRRADDDDVMPAVRR
jgi:hypothetical protein